jgi:hypothetical protein
MFSCQIQCRLQKSSMIFCLEVINLQIKEVFFNAKHIFNLFMSYQKVFDAVKKNQIFKEFLKKFYMTNPMPSSKIFYNFLFSSYKRFNQRGNKKSFKTSCLRSVFTKCFWDSFDSNAYNF